jgi:hypothetical protein
LVNKLKIYFGEIDVLPKLLSRSRKISLSLGDKNILTFLNLLKKIIAFLYATKFKIN